MAISQWKLTRIEVAEKNITMQEVAAKTQIPLLDRLWQSQCRLERSYARAQRDLGASLKIPPPSPAQGQGFRAATRSETQHPRHTARR
jgi:hypothetical protein